MAAFAPTDAANIPRTKSRLRMVIIGLLGALPATERAEVRRQWQISISIPLLRGSMQFQRLQFLKYSRESRLRA
jgi:hypothetical protein